MMIIPRPTAATTLQIPHENNNEAPAEGSDSNDETNEQYSNEKLAEQQAEEFGENDGNIF